MRFIFFRLMVYASLIFLAGNLFHTQIVEGGYYRTLGDKNRMRMVPLEAPRGRVFDRRGNLLATNRPAYDVVATPEDMDAAGIELLGRLLNLSPEEIRKRLRAPREYPFAPAIIQEDISRDLAFLIEERRAELPGVDIRISGLRYYPYQQTASHIIGFIGKINPAEYQRLREQYELYGLNSFVGRTGIEKIFDTRLRGVRGGRQLEVNARGRLIRVLSEKHPEPGQDLTVSIDLDLQKKIMEMIGDQRASVALLDLESEEILALASTPAFDPNVFVSPGHGKERMAFLKDKEAPLLDRGVGSAYPPGSVFKLVTALAALNTGKITPQTTFYCPGSFRLKPGTAPRKCWFAQGHGHVNLSDSIERSCNVYYYNLGKLLTADEIAQYARALGLGEEMKLELSHIDLGLIPDAAWKRNRYKEKWYQGETLSYAIGQSYLLTSPVQILRLVAIIAKDGKRVEPRLLKDQPAPGQGASRISIKEQHIREIKKGMLKAVQSNYGTGQLARLDFGRMAAKTGTAQVPPKEAHAWITGFFPYDNPKIAFVVFVEHGGSGGVAGAKIAKGIVEAWKDLYGPALV